MSHSTGTHRIRILLIDDHEMFLAGLRLLLQLEPDLIVVGEAHNGKEALEAARTQPDIILLDLCLGSEKATDFLPELMHVAERARVLVLTDVSEGELHLEAVCLGAIGVVHKIESPQVLLKAIRKIYGGEAWLNRTMVPRAMKQLQSRHSSKGDPDAVKIASLTPRELELSRPPASRRGDIIIT